MSDDAILSRDLFLRHIKGYWFFTPQDAPMASLEALIGHDAAQRERITDLTRRAEYAEAQLFALESSTKHLGTGAMLEVKQ